MCRRPITSSAKIGSIRRLEVLTIAAHSTMVPCRTRKVQGNGREGAEKVIEAH